MRAWTELNNSRERRWLSSLNFIVALGTQSTNHVERLVDKRKVGIERREVQPVELPREIKSLAVTAVQGGFQSSKSSASRFPMFSDAPANHLFLTARKILF
jgi:hypothetical protein